MPKILKVRFDQVTKSEALKIALKLANSGKAHYIATPNPEFLLEAQTNKKFLRILNRSALNIADGTGILWAAQYLKATRYTKKFTGKLWKWALSLIMIPLNPCSIRKTLPERVTGTDLMEEICKEAAKENLSIFLLGAGKDIAKTAATNLSKNYPGVNIVGTYSGSPKESEEKEIIEKINLAKPKILFVAFGSPKQEFWISHNLPHLKTVNLAMGVGGAFDFIAKARKRAPKWMQKLGLEWLYRLLIQPTRIKRIYNATIKFPIEILTS